MFWSPGSGAKRNGDGKQVLCNGAIGLVSLHSPRNCPHMHLQLPVAGLEGATTPSNCPQMHLQLQ